ncbi:hypothetical protein V5799_015197 [Amblyomma americanum]|uniref:Uncharacterized protein n=1 Tax=Amblyomma americanum TaxID=6943 RepID=A0AAQ4E0U8_AMBAM
MEYSAQPSEVASQLLKGAVLLVLVLFHKQQTVQGNYTKFPRGPFLTLLDAAQVVLLVTSTVLALSTGCRTLKPALSIDSLDAWTLRSATADFAMAFSLVLMAALLAKRWIRCLPPSGFVCTLLGGLATATVLDAVHFCAPAHSLPQWPPQLLRVLYKVPQCSPLHYAQNCGPDCWPRSPTDLGNHHIAASFLPSVEPQPTVLNRTAQ